MRIHRPATPDAAVRLVDDSGGAAYFVGGGTALQVEWSKRETRPTELVDLTALPGFETWTWERGRVRIGAGLRLSSLETDPEMGAALPLLANVTRDVAAPSIRHRATIGGNIAGRSGCLLPALLALEAEIELFDVEGPHLERLDVFLSRPASSTRLITAVLLTAQNCCDRWVHRKIGLRAGFTPSVVGIAGMLRVDGALINEASVAIGGGINRPRRLTAVETILRGRALEAIEPTSLTNEIAALIEAPSDSFRSGRYRSRVAASAIVQGLVQAQRCIAKPRNRPHPVSHNSPDEIEVSRQTLPERWRIRPDISEKVEGHAMFLTDRRSSNMLVGRILMAGVPHAVIHAIDIKAAKALPGVVAVVTAADVPGMNAFGILRQDQPALCRDRVRFVGDVVAAVAAVDAATAALALRLIKVDYEPLPIVDDVAAALEPGAPLIHADGNLVHEASFDKGDADAGFAGCAHVIEETYITPRQMHGFLETEGGFAVPETDGSLTVCVGGQHGTRDQMQIARILGWPVDMIRVVTSPIGGAFGGKDELTIQPALALLALKSGCPVRLHLDRGESVTLGMKANPMRIRMRTGCDANGRLLAQEVDLLADSGAYASFSPAVVNIALEHACGPYLVPNVRTRGRLAYTNNGRCGAFRGFGAAQMTFAIESQIGRLAERVGLDPITMRRRNMREPGSPGYHGHALSPSERLNEMLDAVAASSLWRSPDDEQGQGVLIGTGIAVNHQGNGFGSLAPDESAIRLSLAPNGKIEAAFGFDEMGQGVLTAIKEVIATKLGCCRDDITPVTGDTALTPDSGGTSAGRGAYLMWRGASEAGPKFTVALQRAVALLLGRHPGDLAVAPGGLRDIRSNSGDLLICFADLARMLGPTNLPSVDAKYSFPKTNYTDRNSRFIFASGAVVARVAVDRTTGAVRVLDLHQHTAAGPMIEPAAYLGQIEGGNLQGLGFTTTEHAEMVNGFYVTGNLDGYMLPTVIDAPLRTKVFALERLDAGDLLGPRGVGEMGIVAVAPAVCAAVADATGVWPTKLPIEPETLLDAMGYLRG
jgi:nicotinate dehydrogenase large molybdopterin subunit